MKNYTLPQIVSIVCTVVLSALCALSFFVPFSATLVRSEREGYVCVWQDGGTSEESYYSAFACLSGYDDGKIVLERDGKTGYIPVGEEARESEGVLREGNLNELLSVDLSSFRALERAALARAYAATAWYVDGEWFALSEHGVRRTQTGEASVLVVLSGEPKRAEIERTGAREIVVHENGGVTGEALRGTLVQKITALPPYFMQDGVLYRATPSGVRVVAALPQKTITIVQNQFADEGALLPCTQVEEVIIPFCGSDLSGKGDDYRGEFAHLFAVNREYAVPDTLKKITVSGGRLVSHAFYGCLSVEEIVCCGMDWRAIDKTAFVDCQSLRTLHTPRYSLTLPFENYRSQRLPCGCMLYEREEEV